MLAELLEEEEEDLEEEDDEDWNDGGDEENSDEGEEEESENVEFGENGDVVMLSDRGIEGVISFLLGSGDHNDTSGQENSSGNSGPKVESPDENDLKDRDSMDN